MPDLKLDWKQSCCWVCDLNAFIFHKFLKFVTYSRHVVDNPLSPVAPLTFVIDTFVWSIPKSLDLKFQNYTIGWTWRPLMLLCGSLFVGLKWMQWIGLPSSTFRETCETKGYLCSIDSFFVTNQDCSLIVQNISFSKLLCNPKLRWHLRIKCICQLIWFLFLKTSCDTLDLKLNVKWNLSNIHIGS